jgi:hypothetical protein
MKSYVAASTVFLLAGLSVSSVAANEEVVSSFPESPKESMYRMSPDYNYWDNRYPVGAIIGFVISAILYIYIVVLIFRDIFKSMREYDEVIKDDLDELKKLGLGPRMDEINAELELRLKGKIEDNAADDQLLGEAAKLKAGEY